MLPRPGRSVAGLWPQKTEFDSRSVRTRFLVGKVALGHVYLSLVCYSPVIIIEERLVDKGGDCIPPPPPRSFQKNLKKYIYIYSPINVYTWCNRRNGPDFGRLFLMLNYTEKPQNTYIQIWTVSEIMASEVWNFDSCYTLTDYQIHIETGRNMWFL